MVPVLMPWRSMYLLARKKNTLPYVDSVAIWQILANFLKILAKTRNFFGLRNLLGKQAAREDVGSLNPWRKVCILLKVEFTGTALCTFINLDANF